VSTLELRSSLNRPRQAADRLAPHTCPSSRRKKRRKASPSPEREEGSPVPMPTEDDSQVLPEQPPREGWRLTRLTPPSLSSPASGAQPAD
jgi:hypothetical protein